MIQLQPLSTGQNSHLPDATKPPVVSAIFDQTLGDVSKKSIKDKYLYEKNKKKAYLQLGASFLVLAFYSFFFFYEALSGYLRAPEQIGSMRAKIVEYDEVILPALETSKALHKSAYDEEFEEVISSLKIVFPDDVDKLGIVQLLESFAVEVAANFPPFEFTSINIGQPLQQNGYVVTPISTSIHSSLAGFDRFLALVDRSGNIYEEGENLEKTLLKKMVRLMSISNISVKYQGTDEKTGREGGVDFSVKLNVYSNANQSK